MELDLKRTQLSGYALAINTTLFSEETLESIVPDACPDILRILSTNAFACIKSKDVRDGHLEVRGVVCAQVLYIPDEEEGIRRIDVSIPFSSNMDHSAIQAGSILHLSPCVLNADTRMLNPRKVYVRTEVALGVSCYSSYRKEIAFGCNADPRFGVQEKQENSRICVIKGVQSKAFSFADDLSLPGSKPDLEELLSHHLSAACSESKVIGSKLIFKGQVFLNLLYKSTDNQLVTASFELPFSQIIEAAETEEEAECDVEVILSDISCKADGEDGRTISVAVNLMAQAVLRQVQNFELLTDLYSTAYELSAEFQEEEFCQISRCDSARIDIREMVETPVQVNAVVDSVLSSGGVSQSWEGSRLQFSADNRIHLLYQGEDGEYYTISRPLPAVYQMEAELGYQYYSWCRCIGERFATPAAGGIEVRLSMEFFYRAEQRQTAKTVVGAALDEETLCDYSRRPSVVLRMAEKTESLWDIAKAYSTTSEEILEANDLSEHDSICGRMLLIPKKR